MNASDHQFLDISGRPPEPLDTLHRNKDKPVDLLWIFRGGGTDVYGTLSKLARMQEALPNTHLAEAEPYIIASSAGTFPGAGLASPNAIDPTLLPYYFKRDISRYLSPNRPIAAEALCEQIGDIRMSDVRIPLSIAAVDITERLEKMSFRYFPSEYGKARGLVLPTDNLPHTKVHDAVLASSSFPAFLGDYEIDGRLYIDMAFLDTHAADFMEYVCNHRVTCPDRQLVCMVFGNIHHDFRREKNERINIKGLNRHFSSAVRTFVQEDIVDLAKRQLGPENVFDFTLYVEQYFSKREAARLPHAFRSDPFAISQRIQWVDHILDSDPRHQEQLERAAELIRTRVMPQVSTAPLIRKPATPDQHRASLVLPLTRVEQIASLGKDFGVTAGLTAALAREYVQPYVQRSMPFVRAGTEYALKAGIQVSNWLGRAWEHAAATLGPHVQQAKVTGWNICFPNTPVDENGRSLGRHPNIKPPEQTHSSTQHTPSESGCTPP